VCVHQVRDHLQQHLRPMVTGAGTVEVAIAKQ
jgi:hypothetical protein